MSRSTGEIADQVTRRARRVDAFVSKLEVLAVEKRLTRADIERAYTGAFISFFASYENAWEDLFFGLLMKRLNHPRAVQPLVDIRSERVARSIVRGRAKGYMDWLPPERTSERAALFLGSGRPFSDVDSGDRAALNRYISIRNALAHESRHAILMFQRQVIAGRALPPSERRPAGYLRGAHALGQTRMNLALAELTLIFRRLCS
jgi:hypothetical protein